MRTDQIALQLYTVRRSLADDLPGTLRAVSDAGYSAVELAGLPDMDAAALADLLAESGLRAVASHEAIDGLRTDVDAVARRLMTLGCPRAIVPWLPVRDRESADAVRRVAAELGVLARRFGDAGITLGYHNHDFEFEPVDGTTAWDILLTEAPPIVEFEIDVYWTSVAGMDPVTAIDCRARSRPTAAHEGPGRERPGTP